MLDTVCICICKTRKLNCHSKYLSDLFEIDSETGNLQSLAIDREWSVIYSMYQPQFTVTLRLVNETAESRRKRSYMEDYLLRPKFAYDTDSDRTWTYVENQIMNLPNQVVVYVVVDDINDNSPVFEKTDFVVGYPSQDLALEILPPYITVVQVINFLTIILLSFLFYVLLYYQLLLHFLGILV